MGQLEPVSADTIPVMTLEIEIIRRRFHSKVIGTKHIVCRGVLTRTLQTIDPRQNPNPNTGNKMLSLLGLGLGFGGGCSGVPVQGFFLEATYLRNYRGSIPVAPI